MSKTEPWLRLYTETIDDEKLDVAASKVGCPYDTILATWTILLCFAKKAPVEGYLIVAMNVPLTVESIAKKLRRPNEIELVGRILAVFVELDMLQEENGYQTIAHWDERQFKSDDSTARWQAWSEKKRVKMPPPPSSNVGQTFEPCDPPTAQSQSQIHINSSSTTTAPAIPKTPLEAQENPMIQLYRQVTGMFPPEKDYRTIVETILLIQNLRKTDDCGQIEAYLIPFWASWRDSKRQDGQPYDPRNITWLVDWAVTGKRPIQARAPTPRNGGRPVHPSRASPGGAAPPNEYSPEGVAAAAEKVRQQMDALNKAKPNAS